MACDYIQFYYMEQYLFDDVRKRFIDYGAIKPFDLLLILHWKAARAKTMHMKRLKEIVGGTFSQATKEIAFALSRASDSKKRLEVLMNKWGFRLPTATAILTVLYPDEFTVYDKRVREVLGCKRVREEFSERSWSKLWDDYCGFKERVIAAGPVLLSLRDKDRYLWGKSLSETIKSDLRRHNEMHRA